MRTGEGPVVALYIIVILVLIGMFVIDTRRDIEHLHGLIDERDAVIEQQIINNARQKVVIEGLWNYILTGETIYHSKPHNDDTRPVH